MDMDLHSENERHPDPDLDRPREGPSGADTREISSASYVAYWYPGRQDSIAVRILGMLREK